MSYKDFLDECALEHADSTVNTFVLNYLSYHRLGQADSPTDERLRRFFGKRRIYLTIQKNPVTFNGEQWRQVKQIFCHHQIQYASGKGFFEIVPNKVPCAATSQTMVSAPALAGA